MKPHTKKMLAPLVITGLLAVCMVAYGFLIAAQPLQLVWKILIGAIPLALLCASVSVLIQRIKEIRSGEEDDLGQY